MIRYICFRFDVSLWGYASLRIHRGLMPLSQPWVAGSGNVVTIDVSNARDEPNIRFKRVFDTNTASQPKPDISRVFVRLFVSSSGSVCTLHALCQSHTAHLQRHTPVSDLRTQTAAARSRGEVETHCSVNSSFTTLIMKKTIIYISSEDLLLIEINNKYSNFYSIHASFRYKIMYRFKPRPFSAKTRPLPV